MKLTKLAVAVGFQALSLSGCYVVPVGPDGNYAIYIPTTPPPHSGPTHLHPAQPAQPAQPRALQARLYPENELATQTGMVSGTVTNMMTGKGRFQMHSGEERKGIASAYGASGSFMSCEYQMNTPMQGAGTCMFSNGAKYKVHLGN